MKQHSHPVLRTMTLRRAKCWAATGPQSWRLGFEYPDWRACFADRLATLERLASVYPHYKAALAATDAQVYIAEVSHTWSTDPGRADKCLAIYREYMAESNLGSQGTASLV